MWFENIRIILALLSFGHATAAPSYEEQRAEWDINDITKSWKQMEYNLTKTLYDDATDLENYTAKLLEFQQKKIDVYNRVKIYHYESYQNEGIKRRMHNFAMLRLSEVNATAYVENDMAMHILEAIYNELKIKPYLKHGVTDELNEEQVKAIVRDTKNAEELEHYWKELNERGTLIRATFLEFAPQIRNFSYYTDPQNKLRMYYLPYEHPHIFNEIEQNMNKLRPLYEKMHAYIRFVMQKDFGDSQVPEAASIFEHLFNHILEKVAATKFDPVLSYQKLNSYTETRTLKEADNWLGMLGLPKLPDEFWDKGVTELQTSPCESIFFDFSTEARLFYCPDKTVRNYYQNYRHIVHAEYVTLMSTLPPGLHGEPCPGFGDAIEIAVELSVKSLDNLRKAGLSNKDHDIERLNINKLAYMFFTDIIPLFKHFVYEKFMVDNLNDEIFGHRHNCAYLKTLHRIMGLRPPHTGRNSRSDIPFDALKTLSYRNTEEIFSRILGYQLYRGFCKISDNEKPYGNDLVNCNFKSSLSVGKELNDLMTSGKRKTWRETIASVIPEKQLNTDAIVEYFSPLDKVLSEIIKKNNIVVGWEKELTC